MGKQNLHPTRTSNVVSALCALAVVLVVSLFAYLFCVGVGEAATFNGRMPKWGRAYFEIYSSPGHLAANLPLIQIPAGFSINIGYQFASGPDTTR